MPDDSDSPPHRDVPRIRFTDLVKRERHVVEYPDRDPFELIEVVVKPFLKLTGPEDAERNARYEEVMAARRQEAAAANDTQPAGKRRRFNRYR